MSEHSADPVRHLLVEAPSWDTKQHCACGAVFSSRCEFWHHQAKAYVALLIDGRIVPLPVCEHGQGPCGRCGV